MKKSDNLQKKKCFQKKNLKKNYCSNFVAFSEYQNFKNARKNKALTLDK